MTAMGHKAKTTAITIQARKYNNSRSYLGHTLVMQSMKTLQRKIQAGKQRQLHFNDNDSTSESSGLPKLLVEVLHWFVVCFTPK